ncbi:MAG: hypothetical protein A2857_02315 [Candidatus Levybacteria bacterium RIFCSPHIGHO2_01_FULL_36_15]|nr:MAG: hypothetical protein A2857_02315 [Candidatus Levybacteria bacterium RIFCSPHIGHO2_01_FULL_36_15]
MRILSYKNVLFFFLLVSVVLESTLISFPLFLILSIILFLLDNSVKTMFYIFFMSLILDSVHAERVGVSAIFIFTSFLLLNFYKKGFEITDLKAVVFVIFISSFLYSKVVGYNPGFIFSIAAVTFFSFIFLRFIRRKIFLW